MATKQEDRFFGFKTKMEDFIVEELLEREPTGKGDFIYIFIEKKNLTTMDVVNSLMRKYKLNRKAVGIAGLKDKRGITRQWISIAKRDLPKRGGEEALVSFLKETVRVLEVTYNQVGLRLGKNKGNRFFITLRNQKKLPLEDLKKKTDKILQDIEKKGMPNYYGSQKMGVTGQNPKLGYLLVSGRIKSLKFEKDSPTEKKFKIQAYVSEAFNKYLDARLEQCSLDTVLKGDVVLWKPTGNTLVLENVEEYSDKNMVVTGPIAGYDMMLPKHDSFFLEKKALNKAKIDINNMENFKRFNLFGIRRPILVMLKNMKHMFNKNNDLLLEFDLSSGAYASVLVDILEKGLSNNVKGGMGNVKGKKVRVQVQEKVQGQDQGKKKVKVKKRRVEIIAEKKNKGRRHFKDKKNS